MTHRFPRITRASPRSIPHRDRSPRRARRHSCTREQCPLSSLPPSSAASPPSRRPRSKYVQCFFSSIDGGRRPSRDVSRGTTRTGERARGRYDRRARWSCDGRRGTMRSARARGDDERKGFGNIVSAHRLLGRVIARDDRRDDARARARRRRRQSPARGSSVGSSPSSPRAQATTRARASCTSAR